MRDPLRNIEDFVREKLSFLDNSYPDDWAAFEKKLQRAIFFRRLKVFTSFAVLTTALFLTHQSLVSPIEPAIKNPKDNTEVSVRPAQQTPQLDKLPVPKTIDASPRVAKADDAIVSPPTPASNGPALVPQQREKTTENAEVTNRTLATDDLQVIDKKGINRFRFDLTELIETLDEPEPRRFELGKKDLMVDEYFLAIRSPDYEVMPAEDPGPYISPFQPANPWSYTINVYPNFTFRKFKVDPDKEKLMHSDFIHEMQNNQKSGFSLNIGFEVSKRIGPVTYLNSGIEYITNTYEADFNFTNFRDANIDPYTGEITSYEMKSQSEQIVFTDDNQYHYLNIPLSISYQPWANEHLRMNVEIGASYLRFLKARGTTIDYKTLDIIDLASQDYRKSMASFCFKVGAQYYVTPRINIGFEPTLMYFTNTIYSEEYPFYVIPYSVGLNFNVQVKLN